MAAESRRPRLKLLTDQMFPPEIAEQLRARGYDVAAVSTDPELEGLTDLQLFKAAQARGRALVTEDVGDFFRVHKRYFADGLDHHGLILTSNARFPRGNPANVGALVRALAALLDDPPPLHDSGVWVHWLQPPPGG